MSQKNVERVIGLLATDEAFRRQFAADPRTALNSLRERGLELTECELRALERTDCRCLSQFADTLDPRLQKIDIQGEIA